MDADVVVVGGGPAGLMAAITASRREKEVILVEKMDDPGRKLLITGGGRCNITNLCEVDEFLDNIHGNREFLYSSMYTLSPSALVQMFNDLGLPTKEEEGGRVFPESDESRDVLEVLLKELKETGVKLVHGTAKGIRTQDESVHSIVLEDGNNIECRSLIISTGGMTYRETGSTGDGYEIARYVGHRIVAPSPRLRPFICKDSFLRGLRGTAIQDAELIGPGKVRSRGPLMITHNGISGPVVFDMDLQVDQRFPCNLVLNMFPGLSETEVEDLLSRKLTRDAKKMIPNVLSSWFPKRFSEKIIEKVGIPREITSSQLPRAMRKDLVKFMVSIPLRITGAEDQLGMITSGGVDTTEIDPSNMESKFVKGLFFAGEIIDIHGGTGGYNLQLAWSTGHLAGDNC